MAELLDQYRQQHPEYKDVDDATLANGLYQKFYAGKMDRAAFDQKIGLIKGIPLPPQRSDLMAKTSAFREQMDGPKDVEFPDAGEITDIDIPFKESFVPTMKLGTTIEPSGKANILAEHFKGDSRFQGAYQDKFGNPLIQWEGKPYYVNAPGLSKTDVNDFLSALVAFAPASRAAGAQSTVMARGATALPAYAATDMSMQAAAQSFGSGQRIDPAQTGIVAGVGAAAEAALPPALKYFRRLTGSSQASSLPTYSIPLTKGQATGDIAQIQAEEAMRKGARGESAQNILRGFDDSQREAIQAGAESLDSRMGAGVGIDGQSMSRIGQRLQGDLISARNAAKSAANQAYESVKQSAKAGFTADAFRGMVSGIRRGLVSEGFDLGAPGMESVKRTLDAAEKFAGMGGLKSVDLKAFDLLRKRVNAAISPNRTPSDAALMQVRSNMDAWLDDAVTQGLLMGDEATVQQLKDARGLYRGYQMMFGGKDPAGKKLAKILDDNQATPAQVMNYLVSTSKIGNQGEVKSLIKRMKDIFGESSDQFALLKSAYLIDAFTKPVSGVRQITPTEIKKNIAFLVEGDGRALSNELFSMNEMAKLKAFAQQVEKTITPSAAMNPSGSGWAVFRELIDRGLVPGAARGVTGAVVKGGQLLPFGREFLGAIDNQAGANAAAEAVRGLQQAINVPLVPQSLAGSMREGGQAAPSLVEDNQYMPVKDVR